MNNISNEDLNFCRTEKVIGSENLKKIKNLNITVLGVGGVGGYVVEMLSRIGVGKLTIVDFDKVDQTNINRQSVAFASTIGKNKTEVMQKIINQINANCIVNSHLCKISGNNLPVIISRQTDYVIDAIDDLNAKVEIAKYCNDNNIKLLSSMGTGNRYKQVPKFEISDIYKTSYDGLAKKFRKKLREVGVEKLEVVYTRQPPEKIDGLGSVVYYPLMCAGTIVSYVINQIIN